MTSPSDRRPALVAAYELAASVVAGVAPDQLGASTPCPDYDVATLVDHVVGAGWRAATLGRGENPVGEPFPHVELPDAPGELRDAGEAAAEAWADDERLTATTTMPWGETYTGSTLVDMYLAELAAHTWDLATATGQAPPTDDQLAAAALEGARSMLKPEYRNMMGEGNPYGSEVPAPVDATAWERFVAFTGRSPR